MCTHQILRRWWSKRLPVQIIYAKFWLDFSNTFNFREKLAKHREMRLPKPDSTRLSFFVPSTCFKKMKNGTTKKFLPLEILTHVVRAQTSRPSQPRLCWPPSNLGNVGSHWGSIAGLVCAVFVIYTDLSTDMRIRPRSGEDHLFRSKFTNFRTTQFDEATFLSKLLNVKSFNCNEFSMFWSWTYFCVGWLTNYPTFRRPERKLEWWLP